MNDVRVNKWLDLLDRVLWTGLMAAAGATAAALATDGIGWEEALIFVGVTTLGTVVKVLVGQRVNDGTGSLVGEPVVEATTAPPPPRSVG